MAHIYGMPPLPIIFALINTRVHVGSSYSSDMLTYIETSVTFGFHAILRIPNVDPDYGYI